MNYRLLKPCPLSDPVLKLATFQKDDKPSVRSTSIAIENVLDGKLMVETGFFLGSGILPVILPGQLAVGQWYVGKSNTGFASGSHWQVFL
ncbi:hypothetical protein SIO70_28685 [Chitinophaga sancti]|uniref:hypothetical protein n=1 Tax=Chitinophaga sancti TaxID=1004 RepID=UPI002A74DCD0|nr:hypothetical protein [Chitinophaga sancti]WPQ62341.1 hypothetical protein SIO70_28685 [Chitinophaga sancti]